MCLAATIAPLVVYKISGLLDSSLLGFIGISYVTFKAVQVIIEIRDGLITKMAFSDFLYFISFFPVLTSGPIDRSRRFMEDANKRYSKSEYADLLSRGILLLLIGAVYQMVIATVCSQFFDFHTFRESKTLLFNICLLYTSSIVVSVSRGMVTRETWYVFGSMRTSIMVSERPLPSAYISLDASVVPVRASFPTMST